MCFFVCLCVDTYECVDFLVQGLFESNYIITYVIIYIYMYIYMFVCMYVCVCVFVLVSVCVCMCVCVETHECVDVGHCFGQGRFKCNCIYI